MGLGAAASVIPGISTVGIVISIASICGVERVYGLNMALLVKLFMMVGLMVYDVLGLITGGLGALSAALVFRYLLAAVLSFAGSMLGIRLLRRIASNSGYSLFGVYCWGLALFTFILNLVV